MRSVASGSLAALVAALAILGMILVVRGGIVADQTAPDGSPPAAAPQDGLAHSVPVEIEIPAIGARSSLIPLGLDPDGELEVPSVRTPMQAGWFTGAPTPGELGPAVIVGHIDGNHQPGIFYRLDEVRPGDVVVVTRADGTRPRFVVQRIQQIPKTRFPTSEVYGDTAGPELRLITCGGSFDRDARSYRDNIIAYATLG